MPSADNRSDFYVYALFDWLGVPRYIGKGKGNRIDHHLKPRSRNRPLNAFIKNTLNAIGDIPRSKIRENLTEREALETEIALIAAIGRRSTGTGTLYNLTDGGNGLSGHIFNKKTRKILSDNMRSRMAALTKEQRLAMAKHANYSNSSHEERSAKAKIRWAARSTEERKRISRNMSAAIDRKVSSLAASKRWSLITPDERAEIIRKSAETRKRNNRVLNQLPLPFSG